VKHGRLDDDALAFAIYAVDGKMLLNDGENGAIFRTTIAATGLITGS
jgi:hypothetical protein